MRLLAFLLLLLAGTAATAREPAIRVMSFNVRLPVAQDGPNRWEARRDLAAAMIAETAPDVIGTQELHKRQGDDLVARLPGYGWIGIDRRGGHDDEHMGIFYRRDRLNLVDFGHFWLSDTPQLPGSISWGNLYPRMVTWALFETRDERRRFYLYNTHLPYRGEDEPARIKAAKLIAAHIAGRPADIPVILTGDFNTTPDGAVHATLAQSMVDAFPSASTRSGPEGTFHNYSGRADRRIDWIFSRGLETRRYDAVTEHRGTLQTSDHFPIVADLVWPAAD